MGFDTKELRQIAVDEHNKYRRRHGVPPLKGDNEQIHTVAQRYAEYLAGYNLFQHSNNSPYGENLAGALGSNEAEAIRYAVKMWYDEISSYNYGCPGFAMSTGHFTQVVWKSSTHLGIGVAYNQYKRWWIVVGNYSPPGNYQGQFPENVPRLLSADELRELDEAEEGKSSDKEEDSGESSSEDSSDENNEESGESDTEESSSADEKLENKLWQVAVDEHNKYRALHGVPLVKGNDETIHNVAQNYANMLSRSTCLQHSNNRTYGENLAATTASDGEDAIRKAIKMWYDEVKSYNFNNPGFTSCTGHFTQVVWKACTHIGIGVAYNRSAQWWVVVANYAPHGNVMTQFRENVPRLVEPLQRTKKEKDCTKQLKELKLDDEDKGASSSSDKVEEKCKAEDKSEEKLKDDLWQVAVDEHNKYRRKHGVPDIKGNDEKIHQKAQSYANYLASNDLFQHSRSNYGENLAGALGSNKEEAIRFAVKMWYDEVKSYNFHRPGFAMGTGHFTQVVWKGSTHVGIGVAYNQRKRWWVVVANYSPAGNMMGHFPQNVFPRQG